MKIKTTILEARAVAIIQEIEKIKMLYSKLDDITEILRKQKFKSGKKVRIKDNFKTRNTAFRTTSIRRYELELL